MAEASSSAGKTSPGDVEIKLELTEEEGKEVTRRICSKNRSDPEREALIRTDPAYPASKRLLEACRDRAAKKARGQGGSPDGMSQTAEIQRLQAANRANEQAMTTARDALFAAAVKNKHGAMTAIPVAARPTTGLGWLAGQVATSWQNAVTHADSRQVYFDELNRVQAALTTAMGIDAIVRAPQPANTIVANRDVTAYIHGMRGKFMAKCGELQRSIAERDAATKALAEAKKRIAELEAAAGLTGMAGPSSAAAPAAAASAPAAPAAVPGLTGPQAHEAQRLSGIPMAELIAAIREFPVLKQGIQAIVQVSNTVMHESNKMRAITDMVRNVKPLPMGQQAPAVETVARTKYDEMKGNYHELASLCNESGLKELTGEDATIAPEIKSCLALMKKHGGPDVCGRMIRVQHEQRKALYHTVLSSQALSNNDIVCCKFMSSGAASAVPMYALGVVQNIPHKDTPGALHVQSMFQNDGVYENGKRIGFCIPPTPECYEVVTSRTVRDFFDRVFDTSNVKHLHNNAVKMNYTGKALGTYRDTLYTHTTGMLINFMKDKRGFFTQYEQRNLKDPKAAKAAEEQRLASAEVIDLGDDSDDESAVVSSLRGQQAARS